MYLHVHVHVHCTSGGNTHSLLTNLYNDSVLLLYLFYFFMCHRETFPAVTFTTVKLSGQDVQLVGGISKKSVTTHNQPVTAPVTAPVTTPVTAPVTTTPINTPVTISVTTIQNQSIPMSNHIHNQHHIAKPDSVSSRGSSSTPSRSPSPSLSPSLSPLQQLIQQAKIKKLTMPSPLSNAKASPLLVSNKMNQVIKTGITSESSCTSDHIQVDKLSNGLCVSINGNATEEERLRLMRKRSFDDNDDYNIVRKITRTEYQQEVTSVDTPTCSTTTPTCSTVTPTCSTATPTYYTATPTCSTATPITDPSFRSTSLPPSFNRTKERKIDKARSLTPPIIVPHKHMLDTNKLVSTTSTTSLPGSTSSLITGDSRTVCLWKNCLEYVSYYSTCVYRVL